MNPKVIITCAITGAGDTVGKHPAIPVTPEQIANSALEAASAGAAVVHCHVRDPETGKGTRNVDYYREVMERIRAKNTDVIINLTAGMGGDLMIGDGESPRSFDEDNTDLVGPAERLLHVKELRPDICTLDCGSLNFGDGNGIVVQTPVQLREQARLIQSYGVKPEMEIFDSGNLWFAKQLVAEGLISGIADVPAVPGYSMGRAGQHRDHGLHEVAAAGRLRVGRVRHRQVADADGGAGHHPRRPRPRRA
jgi:uncharacterized protein (DUF849 family)